MKTMLAICLTAVIFAAPAAAASSEWFVTEGGDIRLVLDDNAQETGVLRGALEIVLNPGWKTYWLDPGDTGVPPQVDVSASRDVSAVRILYPVPERFDDGYAVWAGYKDRVSLALEFHVGAAPMIDADVFLGICETICIPVSVRFAIDPADSSDSSADTAVVSAAFAELPDAARDGFAVNRFGQLSDDSIRAHVEIPESADGATLFVASGNGWVFGVPEWRLDGSGAGFDIPVFARPKDQTGEAEVFYTLVSGNASVSGTVAAAGSGSQ